MFYSCLKLRYYLFAKSFILLTDHNNLLWMESSETPKIIRMRIFLQGFNFQVTHVKGKDNVFADWLSRMHDERQIVSTESAEMLLVLESDSELISSFLSNVHNQRMGHHGAQRTWSLLNKHYPGHGVSMSANVLFVKRCGKQWWLLFRLRREQLLPSTRAIYVATIHYTSPQRMQRVFNICMYSS